MSPDVNPPATPAAGHADHRAPVLRIVAGSPSPEEVAAVVAILTSRADGAPEEPVFSQWARHSRQVRPALRPGFGAWRASTMPR